MKFALTLPVILFLSIASFASTYYKGTVVFVDGKSKTGLVESTLSDYVLFKTSENAKEEKIESSQLKSVSIQGKDEVREYYYLKVYLGWGQKRISDPMWLKVVEKGTATLFVNNTSMRGSIHNTTQANFSDYYCIRAGEPAAKMIANIASLNNNQTFRAKAPLYFVDYPELASKIKSKEYTWKDLTIVVKEYNKWITKKK
jgi:hypothetical protein